MKTTKYIQVKNRALIHDYFLSYLLNRTKEAICGAYLNVNFMYIDLGCRIIFSQENTDLFCCIVLLCILEVKCLSLFSKELNLPKY